MRRPHGQQIAPDANTIPPERRQHDRVSRAKKQVQDSQGRIGQPFEVESLLTRLHHHGSISAEHRQAGEIFHSCFRAAQLDPLRAASWLRAGGGNPANVPDHTERAKRHVYLAMQACGGMHTPIGSAAWCILGCEYSIRDWALRQGWNGKPLNESVAKGILLGALSVLALHFGLERPTDTKSA